MTQPRTESFSHVKEESLPVSLKLLYRSLETKMPKFMMDLLKNIRGELKTVNDKKY